MVVTCNLYSLGVMLSDTYCTQGPPSYSQSPSDLLSVTKGHGKHCLIKVTSQPACAWLIGKWKVSLVEQAPRYVFAYVWDLFCIPPPSGIGLPAKPYLEPPYCWISVSSVSSS